MTRLTYHLVPAAVWAVTDRTRPYEPASLASEGFIHCTNGEAELLRTADRHYRDDPRAFNVLTVDLDRVTARWTVEDAAGIYPHVFGPIDQEAIVAVGALVRGSRGAPPDGCEPCPRLHDGPEGAGDPGRRPGGYGYRLAAGVPTAAPGLITEAGD